MHLLAPIQTVVLISNLIILIYGCYCSFPTNKLKFNFRVIGTTYLTASESEFCVYLCWGKSDCTSNTSDFPPNTAPELTSRKEDAKPKKAHPNVDDVHSTSGSSAVFPIDSVFDGGAFTYTGRWDIRAVFLTLQ